jgi:hypothetical protein
VRTAMPLARGVLHTKNDRRLAHWPDGEWLAVVLSSQSRAAAVSASNARWLRVCVLQGSSPCTSRSGSCGKETVFGTSPRACAPREKATSNPHSCPPPPLPVRQPAHAGYSSVGARLRRVCRLCRVPCHSVEFFVAVVMLVAILVILDIAYYSTGPMRIPGYGA